MQSKLSYEELERENVSLRERIKALESELSEVKALLKKVLGQDSHNSHKALSQDRKRYPKTKLKVKEKTKQTASTRKTLEYSAEPDELKELVLGLQGCGCGKSLSELPSHYERI